MVKNYTHYIIIKKPNVDDTTLEIISRIKTAFEHFDLKECVGYYDKPTLIFAIGGDGTFLSAMRVAVQYDNALIIGFNTGTLGFLTNQIPLELNEYLNFLVYGDLTTFTVEKRTILQATYNTDNQHSYIAANEFTVTNTDMRMLNLEIKINDQFVNTVRGNGVIVSTPTGSTGLALSSNGVIISPTTKILEILPFIPHSLSSRPIITSDNDTIMITVKDPNDNICLVGDGINYTKDIILSKNLDQGSTDLNFTIRKYHKSVNIFRNDDWNFFNVLKHKLRW